MSPKGTVKKSFERTDNKMSSSIFIPVFNFQMFVFVSVNIYNAARELYINDIVQQQKNPAVNDYFQVFFHQ